MADGAEAKAARRAARTEPFVHEFGGESFVCEPELPVDVVLAYGTLACGSRAEIEVWSVAHLLVDSPCDTSCADAGLFYADRACPAERDFRLRLRKVRIDDRRPSQDDLAEFYERVFDAYAVTEGESRSSAELPAPAGDASSGTPSEPDSTSTPSGAGAAGVPAGSMT